MPRNGDADFREELLVARANELADGIGNLINRAIGLARRSRPKGVQPTDLRPAEADALSSICSGLASAIDDALGICDLRAAAAALWDAVVEAKRFVSATRPWEFAKPERAGDPTAAGHLDAVLATLVGACRTIARELGPFLPSAAERVGNALDEWDVERGRALFPKFGSVA